MYQINRNDLRCEDEIVRSWSGDLSKPVVSIVCITYNHLDFIEDAIIGFLRQRCDFPFEIIIHDDASTDGTANVVKEYERAYPRIIRAIYQNENQYSKGNRPGRIARSVAKAPYLAICEGDDYWISDDKLAIQKELLDNNNDISIIFHNAYKYDGNTFKSWQNVISFESGQAVTTLEDVLRYSIQFAPTGSYFFRREIESFIAELEFVPPVWDFAVEVIAHKYGNGLFLSNYMSVYRTSVSGSWTDGQQKDIKKKFDFAMKQIYFHHWIVKNFDFIVESDIEVRTNSLWKAILKYYLYTGDYNAFKDIFSQKVNPNRLGTKMRLLCKLVLMSRISFRLLRKIIYLRQKNT